MATPSRRSFLKTLLAAPLAIKAVPLLLELPAVPPPAVITLDELNQVTLSMLPALYANMFKAQPFLAYLRRTGE